MTFHPSRRREDLKIVQLQYRLSSSGDFVRRLHNEFLALGIDSKIVALYADSLSPHQRILGKRSKLKAIIDGKVQSQLLKDKTKEYGMFSYPVLGSDVSNLEEVRSADCIYLHWVLLGFLNLNSIRKLAKLGKPIIIVMHDMWSITGGCHHSFTCLKYLSGCHACPAFSKVGYIDLASRHFAAKLKLYRNYDNLYFVSPSKWLLQCAEQSLLVKGKPIVHIPNVLNRAIYKPFSKTEARNILNIPEEETVIAFGAVSVNDPYKGWSYLRSALEIMHHSDEQDKISILIFGGSDPDEIAEQIPFRATLMGHIKDEIMMAIVYNAADIFVAPSLADNLPYTIFESLACGTPVVAFDVGGIPDLIVHKENGYLARYKEPMDLVAGMKYCIEHRIQGFTPEALETHTTMQKHIDLIHSCLRHESEFEKTPVS